MSFSPDCMWCLTACYDLFLIFNKYGFQHWQAMTWQAYNHPSLCAGDRFQDPLQKKGKENENPRIIDRPSKSMFSYCYCFYLLGRNIVMGAASFVLVSPWTSCHKGRRRLRVVQQIWCTSPLKGPSDIFLFLGWPREKRGVSIFPYLRPWLSDSMMHHTFVMP